MKVFKIIRQNDETGVSGTGNVMDGVVFDDGQVIVSWKTDVKSTGFYNSWEDFKKVHIDPHPTNKTLVREINVDWNTKGVQVAEYEL